MILNSAVAEAKKEGDGFEIIPLQGLMEKLNDTTGTGDGSGDRNRSASETLQVDERDRKSGMTCHVHRNTKTL